MRMSLPRCPHGVLQSGPWFIRVSRRKHAFGRASIFGSFNPLRLMPPRHPASDCAQIARHFPLAAPFRYAFRNAPSSDENAGVLQTQCFKWCALESCLRGQMPLSRKP